MASNLQGSRHAPQRLHLSWMRMATRLESFLSSAADFYRESVSLSTSSIAPNGHAFTHRPQPVQLSRMMFGGITSRPHSR